MRQLFLARLEFRLGDTQLLPAGETVEDWDGHQDGCPVDGLVAAEIGRTRRAHLQVEPPDVGVEEELRIVRVARPLYRCPRGANLGKPGDEVRSLLESSGDELVQRPGRVRVE